jgi:hypothetical protein
MLPFLLVGIDFEGDSREIQFNELSAAIAAGQNFLKADASGPPWRSFEVWGNNPLPKTRKFYTTIFWIQPPNLPAE